MSHISSPGRVPDPRGQMKPSLRLMGLMASAALIGAAMTPAVALAQNSYDGANRSSVSLGSTPRMVNLPRGTSFAVELPADAHDVIVSNPQVAEAVLHNQRRVTVIGVAAGETDAIFLDAQGRTLLALKIRVDAGVGALQDTISRVVPGAQVRAEAVNDSIILTGLAASPAEADRISQIARAFVATPDKVLNLMSISGSDQVTLKVRVVEVQRSSVKQLGVDLNAIIGNVADGLSLANLSSFPVSGNQLGGGALRYSDGTGEGITSTLRAFERVGLIRTLAEPNVTTVNGEAASFLAGGEFPVPTGRDQNGNVTIEFKPFGVSLGFRPVILSEGRISLQISVEVSELTTTGGFTIGSGTNSTLTVSGLNVRRVENTVEIPSGGSMMIAGLLQETTRQTVDELPGVADVPVLGALFRSRDYLSGETELVVIVEPYIVSPTSPGRLQTPADGLQIAGDLQTILFGQLNQAYGSPAPTGAPGTGWQGPVGYVIE